MRFTAILFVLLFALAASAEEKTRIAVMEFASKGGVTPEQMEALGDMLANEIREMGEFRVIGKSDIRAALDLEQQKSLLGCDDATCMAEMGGALGVRYVVVGNVSKFGEMFLLNLKILDVEKIRVAKGISKKIGGGEDKLIDALSGAAKELITGAKIGITPAVDKPLETAPEKPVTAVVEPPPPGPEEKPAPPPRVTPPGIEAAAPSSAMNTWGHVTFWTGVGATAFGLVSMAIAIKEAGVYGDWDEDPDARLGSRNAARGWTGAMWVGCGAGVSLMATGLILWLLDDEPGGTMAAASPATDGQGLVLTVGGRW